MIISVTIAYLRIVCARIIVVGKFSVQEFFSASGEKFLSTNFFSKIRSDDGQRVRILRKKSESKLNNTSWRDPGWRAFAKSDIVQAKWKH